MIIGRTRYSAEKNSNKNLLTREKYFFISHLAREFIIKNEVKELPVSLNDIIKNNKWKTICYKKLRKLGNAEYQQLMIKNIGFTIGTPDDKYFICYDDSQDVTAQRFTIAHEIGHIVLNHFRNFIENREQEANMFAVRLLMPMCVLYECDVRSIEEIELLCQVSKISAGYRFDRLEMLRERQKFYTDKNEILLYKNFKHFIKNIKKLKKKAKCGPDNFHTNKIKEVNSLAKKSQTNL